MPSSSENPASTTDVADLQTGRIAGRHGRQRRRRRRPGPEPNGCARQLPNSSPAVSSNHHSCVAVGGQRGVHRAVRPIGRRPCATPPVDVPAVDLVAAGRVRDVDGARPGASRAQSGRLMPDGGEPLPPALFERGVVEQGVRDLRGRMGELSGHDLASCLLRRSCPARAVSRATSLLAVLITPDEFAEATNQRDQPVDQPRSSRASTTAARRN